MNNNLTMPRMILLLVEVIVFAVLLVTASCHFGMGDGAKITAAYLVAYLIPRTILNHARATSTAARVILCLLTILLICVCYTRLTNWTAVDGYSLEIPDIKGDQRSYYKWALYLLDGRLQAEPVVYPGLSMMMVALWKVLGVSVIWPQAMNIMFTLTSVVVSALTTRRLLSGYTTASPRTVIIISLLLNCFLFYYIMIGAAVLKEGAIYLAMSMAGFALSSMAATDSERFTLWRDLILFAVACVIIGFVRTTYLYFVLVGVIIMVIPHWRRDWGMALAMVVMVALAMLAGNEVASYSFARHSEIIGGGWNMQHTYVEAYTQRYYLRLIGNYFLYSPLHKLVLLPLTMSVQFIIPFPWLNYEAPNLLNIISRATYGWYMVGGIALFYYLFLSWRRHENMGAWPWWPALSFMALAYVMAGSVARYELPMEPLFIPVVIFTLYKLREGRYTKAFKWWSVLFLILLTITLLLCLEVQHATISSLLHATPLRHYLHELFPAL